MSSGYCGLKHKQSHQLKDHRTENLSKCINIKCRERIISIKITNASVIHGCMNQNFYCVAECSWYKISTKRQNRATCPYFAYYKTCLTRLFSLWFIQDRWRICPLVFQAKVWTYSALSHDLNQWLCFVSGTPGTNSATWKPCILLSFEKKNAFEISPPLQLT